MNLYLRATGVAFEHALTTFVRRRRTHVAAALVMLPAFLPLIVMLIPHGNDDDLSRDWVIRQMIELFYVNGVTPLLALFFAAMLIGEDVETQTISYVLTRSVPRSAWVLGRFGAYLAVTSGIVLISILCLCLASLAVPSGDAAVGIGRLARYQGVATMSLLGYGAFCTFLSSVFRHPIVVGVLVLFGWERLALLAPGVTDFLTVTKYVNALLPEGGISFRRIVDEIAGGMLLSGFKVGPLTAVLTLLGIGAVCLALTSFVVREKEFTTPVAVTE